MKNKDDQSIWCNTFVPCHSFPRKFFGKSERKVRRLFVIIIIIYLQPLSSVLITPDTVRYYASFIRSSATITDLTINFGTGLVRYEELLRVPLTAPGELDPHTMIRITVGMNPPLADNDPIVGITDGVHSNQFQLVEQGTPSTTVNPCEIYQGTHNGRTAPHGDPVAGEYVMIFDPQHKFGACSTNTGFATDGKFTYQVDASKGLSLLVNRDQTPEQYTFHYFLVEFL